MTTDQDAAALAELRAVIDGLDGQIVALLAERTRAVGRVAAYKHDAAAVQAPDRVRQVVDRVRALAEQHGMPAEIAEAVYRTMIEELTRYEMVHAGHA
ncbi:chorismate mutase [Kitasatospora sp. NPDC006697]|uniref:chorismate mutase n=1 Tax=Kitasatospora sp. NPDC006697 TaxID=3364020 RepID=UPI0036B3D086